MVRTSAGARGLKLVEPGTPGASKFRVRYTDTSVSPNEEKIMAIAYIGITTCEELQMIGHHPSYKVYFLSKNIDCSATNPANPSYANSLWDKGYSDYYSGKGFDGIAGTEDDNVPALDDLGTQGFNPAVFNDGRFSGLNFNISNLHINRVGTVGLFSVTRGAMIDHIGLINVNIEGTGSAGGLVGYAWGGGSIANVFVTGTVKGGDASGGLVGNIFEGNISQSYAVVDVTGGKYVGGLVGFLTWSNISNSYAEGNVTASGNCSGGLIGLAHQMGSITNSYARGNVTGFYDVGNFAGLTFDFPPTITNCFGTGSVTGVWRMGGFIGRNESVAANNWWFNAMDDSAAGNKAASVNDFLGTGSGTGGAVYTDATTPWDFVNVWQAVSCNTPNLRGVGGPQNAADPVGIQITPGQVSAGRFNNMCYFTTPSGCTDSATPTCAGGGDTVTRNWIGAINFCDALDYAGMQDWYLPAGAYNGAEQDLLYNNRTILGGFAGNWYWSSTAYDTSNSWAWQFGGGNSDSSTVQQFMAMNVRCVRRD
jgi:hypothetical protein